MDELFCTFTKPQVSIANQVLVVLYVIYNLYLNYLTERMVEFIGASCAKFPIRSEAFGTNCFVSHIIIKYYSAKHS